MAMLREHDALPSFRLESGTGKMIGPQDYKGKKNLVMVFFDVHCVPCNDFLSQIAERYVDYEELETEVLSVGEGNTDDVREYANMQALPFPVVADPDHHVSKHYTESIPTILVADRFGEIRAVITAEGDEHFPDQQKILDNLELVQLECPECGVPTWTM